MAHFAVPIFGYLEIASSHTSTPRRCAHDEPKHYEIPNPTAHPTAKCFRRWPLCDQGHVSTHTSEYAVQWKRTCLLRWRAQSRLLLRSLELSAMRCPCPAALRPRSLLALLEVQGPGWWRPLAAACPGMTGDLTHSCGSLPDSSDGSSIADRSGLFRISLGDEAASPALNDVPPTSPLATSCEDPRASANTQRQLLQRRLPNRPCRTTRAGPSSIPCWPGCRSHKLR